MKKIIIALISSITAVSLCGCDGSQMNVDALLEAQDTLSTYADQLEEMEEYVGTIQDSVSEGVDSVNQLMDWYNNEAWAGNPYISSPISEEEVENLIEIGRDEAESYIDPNASYGVLTDEDIDFYTEYFMAPENYGFILSTYEKPEDCDVNQVFANGAGVETELTALEKKSKKLKDYASKIDKDDVEAILNKNLGIDSDALTTPIEYIESGDTSFLAIPEYDVTPLEYVCRGGFHYNDLNLIMMCTGDLGEPPFAVTIFTRNGEDIKILKNYYSEDMEGLEFDGTFLYELYDLMQDSDVAAVMRIPADDGELYLGSVFEKGVGENGIIIS